MKRNSAMKLSKYILLASLLLVSANVANASSYRHDEEDQQVEVIENDSIKTVSDRSEGRRYRDGRHREGRHREGRRHNEHDENHYNRNRN
jgi:hypothetical protein